MSIAVFKKLHHRLSLSVEDCEDIAWWSHFLPLCNGSALFIKPSWTTAVTFDIFIDAVASVDAVGFHQRRTLVLHSLASRPKGAYHMNGTIPDRSGAETSGC